MLLPPPRINACTCVHNESMTFKACDDSHVKWSNTLSTTPNDLRRWTKSAAYDNVFSWFQKLLKILARYQDSWPSHGVWLLKGQCGWHAKSLKMISSFSAGAMAMKSPPRLEWHGPFPSTRARMSVNICGGSRELSKFALMNWAAWGFGSANQRHCDAIWHSCSHAAARQIWNPDMRKKWIQPEWGRGAWMSLRTSTVEYKHCQVMANLKDNEYS